MRSLFIHLLAFATVAPATSSFNTREAPKLQLSEAKRIRKGTEECFIRDPIKRVPTTIRFEQLGPNDCGSECQGFGKGRLNTPRGLGLAYKRETVNNLVFENESDWHVIECGAPQFVGKLEANACGNSSRALYAGTSKDVMSFGTAVHLGNNKILNFDLKSLYITTAGTAQGVQNRTTHIEISASDYNENLIKFIDKSIGQEGVRRKLTVGPEFERLDRISISVVYHDPFNGFDDAQNFAIDDVELVENIYERSICPRKPEVNKIISSCTPSPTATKTWTVKFDETPLTSGVPGANPTDYAELIWNNEYPIWDKETIRKIQNPPYFPIQPAFPSEPNVVFGNGSIEITSNTAYEHFGLEEFYILQSWGFQANDYAIITIVGRRDPYDGSGLPEKVELEVRITNNPKYPWISRIRIADYPQLVDGFKRLRALSIFAEYVDPKLGKRAPAPFVLDNMVFTRELGEGRACRASPETGWLTVDFENDVELGQKVPVWYEGFIFHPNGYTISSIDSYQPGTNGYIAPISGKNAAKANISSPLNRFFFDRYRDTGFDSDYLFDFESVTITIDVLANDTETLNNLRIGVFARDACGFATTTVPEFNGKPFSERMGWGYYARFFPPTLVLSTGDSSLDSKRQQYTLMYPWKAISYIELDVRKLPSFEQVPFWVDKFTYRRNRDYALPACGLCRDVAPDGSNDYNGRYCEVPAIPR